MTIPDTPKTLLDELARQGELDELKWRQFDTLYRPVIAFFIRQRFASLTGETDDIVQNIMVKLVTVLRKRQYRSDRSRFRTYLAALVHNYCIDYLKESSRRVEIPIDSIDIDALSTGHTPYAALTQLDRQWAEGCFQAARRHVLECVPLDPLHKKIFLEIERGRTSDQVAQKNGVSAAAVRQIKHRISDLINAYCREMID